MNIWRAILNISGWKVDIDPLPPGKCVICVAPHTSNWDFIIGYAAYRSLGRKANFLMKESWFFFPLGFFFRKMGGIPVPRKRGSSLSQTIIKRFSDTDYLNLAVTPEGTRSLTEDWRKGFIYIALGAHVNIMLGQIDYMRKSVVIHHSFHPTGNVDEDLRKIKDFYRHTGQGARYPKKFSAG